MAAFDRACSASTTCGPFRAKLGFLCPPVGLNLLLSSYRFNKPMAEVTRATLPMLLVLLVGVLLITYFPPLTTFLPRLFK